MEKKDIKERLSHSNIRSHSHYNKNKMVKTLCTVDSSDIDLKDHKQKHHNNKNNDFLKAPGFKNKRLMTIEYDYVPPKSKNKRKSSIKSKQNQCSKNQTPLHKNSTLKNFY